MHTCFFSRFLYCFIVETNLAWGKSFWVEKKKKKKIFTKNEKYLLERKKKKKKYGFFFSCIKMSPLYCYTNISNWLIFTWHGTVKFVANINA
ncbi:hypothetical protein C1646_718576 [Rhizophagus diaphanus]|nr:hypothetical protein C1646_718576 [Rhizophagus diaphanus] [Rhizophagus sp. MUCL 43196]